MSPRPPVRLRRTAGFVLLALAVNAPSPTLGFDRARYRPGRLGDLVRTRATAAGIILAADVPIRATVVYSGESRAIHDDSRRLIAAWAESTKLPGIPELFTREVKVREGSVEYWLPIQQMLVLPMSELRAQEEVEVFVIYIGQVDRRHVFLLNAFQHDGPHPRRR